MTKDTEAVPSFEDWTESWPAESVMDPRAAKAARQARAPERKPAKAARKSTLAEDVAEGVKATQAAEAENHRRAKESGEVEAAERARAVARDTAAINAAAKAAPVRVSEPEPESANPVVRALRGAAVEGQVGRLRVDPASLQPTLEEFAQVGAYAREGRFSTSAVLTVDRDGPGRLGVHVQTPARVSAYVRGEPFVTELDSPAGHSFLATEIADVRSLPNVGSLLDMLIVVAEGAIPADLSGLQRLASETRAAVALLDSTAEHGWTPVDP